MGQRKQYQEGSKDLKVHGKEWCVLPAPETCGKGVLGKRLEGEAPAWAQRAVGEWAHLDPKE